MKNFIKRKKGSGFTLIELLVVVAIIGLLASVVLASLNTARAKGRDAKRLAEIHSLQNALELYYNDNGHYPDVLSASSGAYAAAWPTLLSSSYIGSMPVDSVNTATQYGYYYAAQYKPNGNCGFTNVPGVNTNYILATRLENSSASSNSCPGGFSGWDNGALNYIVGVGQ